MAALPYAVDTCRPTLSPLGSSSSPLAVDDGLHLVDDHLNLGTAVAPPVAHGCLGVDQLPLECDLPRGGNLVIMSSRPPWSASTMGGRGGSTRCNMKGAECGEELWHRADSGTGCGYTGVPGIDCVAGWTQSGGLPHLEVARATGVGSALNMDVIPELLHQLTWQAARFECQTICITQPQRACAYLWLRDDRGPRTVTLSASAFVS
jgi:hypothetical protein